MVEVHERTFHSGGVVLSGTLHVPRVETRVPAVVVLHAASSPERTNPLYAHLIAMLPPMKVAVFVFDRPGSGQSAGNLDDSD